MWTLTHSWYAVMGGYCYHLPEEFRIYLPEGQDRTELALRDEALRFVARNEPSVIPRLTVNTIMDKSTAGAFVKIITLFQALWFILQCVARMSLGLSISLLELTTFAHCIVGLVIGWLWLNKPLNISQADPLDIPDSAKEPHWLMAILYTLSSFDGEDSDEDKYRKRATPEPAEHKEEDASDSDRTLREEDSGYRVYLQPVGQHSPMSFGGLGLDVSSPARPPSSRPVTGKDNSAGPVAPPATSRPGTGSSRPRPQTASTSPPTSTYAENSLLETSHTTADASRRLSLRMEIAQRGWEHYVLNPLTAQDTTGPGPRGASATNPESDASRRRSRERTRRRLARAFRNTLVDRVPNFPRRRHNRYHQPGGGSSQPRSRWDMGDGGERASRRTRLGIALTGLLYGGLHLLAWDASFHSAAESALWRLAALSLASSGLLVPVTHAEGVLSRVLRPWTEEGAADEAAEAEAAGLAGSAPARPRHGGRAWRRCLWGAYEWCFLRMVEVSRVLRVLVMAGVAVVYFGLRIFIFFECLVNLAYLPPSAYEVVRWSQYVPHIG